MTGCHELVANATKFLALCGYKKQQLSLLVLSGFSFFWGFSSLSSCINSALLDFLPEPRFGAVGHTDTHHGRASEKRVYDEVSMELS